MNSPTAGPPTPTYHLKMNCTTESVRSVTVSVPAHMFKQGNWYSLVSSELLVAPYMVIAYNSSST